MRTLWALPVQHQLVLRIADIDAGAVGVRRARVGARGRAEWVVAGPPLLLAGAETVGKPVLVRVTTELALGAWTDLLDRVSVNVQ